MQITYTLKKSKEIAQGEYDPATRMLKLSSGNELNLSREDDVKLAKKLIYSKVVTMPEMKLVTLEALSRM